MCVPGFLARAVSYYLSYLPISVLSCDIFIELLKLDVSDTLKAMAVVASPLIYFKIN